MSHDPGSDGQQLTTRYSTAFMIIPEDIVPDKAQTGQSSKDEGEKE